jgi:hypothetical protein
VNREDVLVISLFDGSFHLVRGVSSSEPALDNDGGGSLSTAKLSKNARNLFLRAEQPQQTAPLTRLDANRISGMVSYDGAANVLWLHE